MPFSDESPYAFAKVITDVPRGPAFAVWRKNYVIPRMRYLADTEFVVVFE